MQTGGFKREENGHATVDFLRASGRRRLRRLPLLRQGGGAGDRQDPSHREAGEIWRDGYAGQGSEDRRIPPGQGLSREPARVQERASAVTELAPAKINLALHVT